MSDKPIIVDGIKVNITIEDIDDMEVAELMEEGLVVKALRKVFGQKDYEAIKEHFKEKNGGKAKLSDVSEWFQKVSNRLGADAKN